MESSLFSRRRVRLACIIVSLAAAFFIASNLARAERPFPKPQGLVNDFAGVISPQYERKISVLTREMLEKTGTAIVVATMPDIGGAEYNDYTNRLYSAWGIGKKGEDKGVLIFVTIKERKMRIETGYGVEGILPDGLVGEIRDRYMIPYLRKNQFGEGILNGALAISQVIAKDAGVQLTGTSAKTGPPESVEIAESTKKPEALKWIPESLDLGQRLRNELTPPQMFDRVSPSVWTVFSATTAENLRAMNNVSQASAVAVSGTKLLTNHHVIDNRPYVVVKHGDRFAKAVVYSGDRMSDRCILLVPGVKLTPVRGYRRFSTLSVGEEVYTVGSPKGLENTLGEGIISAKRQLKGLDIIQTTAQVSEGSSGGGLFDHFGNLIGITTFKVIQGEGLNFAISIGDYTR